MRNIARQLIAEEHEATDPNQARAAFRVCNRLGASLSVLTGRKGFGSLLDRALSLAAQEAPWLKEVQIEDKGVLLFPSPAVEAKVTSRNAARGGLALVEALLQLLATFVGEALTLRLVQQVWPTVALKRGKI